MRLLLIALAVGGVSACSTTATDEAMCGALRAPMAALRVGLEANLQTTPDAVGEPATDVVKITEAGC